MNIKLVFPAELCLSACKKYEFIPLVVMCLPKLCSVGIDLHARTRCSGYQA